jgi:predicted Zn-dependent protease with MMP-like domain
VAFLTADMPTRDQMRTSGTLHGRQTLLGLYEGIPLPRRDGGYSGVLPDVITVFKRPHELMAADMEALARDVHETVWHEVAHYFGLDHGQINALSE